MCLCHIYKCVKDTLIECVFATFFSNHSGHVDTRVGCVRVERRPPEDAGVRTGSGDEGEEGGPGPPGL